VNLPPSRFSWSPEERGEQRRVAVHWLADQIERQDWLQLAA